MNTEAVSSVLTRWHIQHKVCEQGILVNRDSVIANTIAHGENEHYQRLLTKLNSEFNGRFTYGYKTDDDLFLVQITGG